MNVNGQHNHVQVCLYLKSNLMGSYRGIVICIGYRERYTETDRMIASSLLVREKSSSVMRMYEMTP